MLSMGKRAGDGRITSSVFCFLVAALAGCGSGAPEAEQAARPDPATGPRASTVTMRVAVDLPDTLARACEAWANARSARIEWIAIDDSVTLATLREVAAEALDAQLLADDLRAFSAAGEARAAELWLGEVGQRDARTFGLAWRASLHALRGAGSLDWAALPRLGNDVHLSQDQLGDTFLALVASLGGAQAGTLDAGSDAAMEALAFLTDLSARVTVDPVDEPVSPQGSTAFTAMRADPRRGDQWRSLPTPDADSSGAVLARPRLLVLPRGGDHLDLGDELARWLTEPAQMQLLFAHDPVPTPLLRTMDSKSSSQAAVLALREFAVAAPYRGVDAVRWNVLLDEAVQAAVSRRRHPEAALAEAERRRKERVEP